MNPAPEPNSDRRGPAIKVFGVAAEVLEAAQMSETELRREIKVMFFEKERLTLAQAGRMAEMNRLDFQHLLAGRGISVHYDVEEFTEEIETLRKLGRL